MVYAGRIIQRVKQGIDEKENNGWLANVAVS